MTPNSIETLTRLLFFFFFLLNFLCSFLVIWSRTWVITEHTHTQTHLGWVIFCWIATKARLWVAHAMCTRTIRTRVNKTRHEWPMVILTRRDKLPSTCRVARERERDSKELFGRFLTILLLLLLHLWFEHPCSGSYFFPNKQKEDGRANSSQSWTFATKTNSLSRNDSTNNNKDQVSMSFLLNFWSFSFKRTRTKQRIAVVGSEGAP